MDRIKRNERLGAMTRILTQSPNRIFTLSTFCELFSAAKSTLSEDVDLLRQSFERFGQGELTTIAGAAGGIRYRATISMEQSMLALKQLSTRLSEKGRILPGGFLYTSDIIAETDTTETIGRILAMPYYDMHPDLVLTMETKGIPVALMTAKMLDVPLVIARRDSGADEGPAVKISYIAGSGRMETMALARRAVAPKQRVLIVDDFMRGGGTLRGMMDIMHEFSAEVVGCAVMIATEMPLKKIVDDALSLLVLKSVDTTDGIVKIQPSEAFR